VRIRVIVGVVLLGGVAAYFFSIERQIHAAEALCDAYPAGSRIGNIDAIDGASSLARRGPMPVTGKAESDLFIYCAGLTLCEYSCMLEIESGLVTAATFRGADQ